MKKHNYLILILLALFASCEVLNPEDDDDDNGGTNVTGSLICKTDSTGGFCYDFSVDAATPQAIPDAVCEALDGNVTYPDSCVATGSTGKCVAETTGGTAYTYHLRSYFNDATTEESTCDSLSGTWTLD